MTLIELTYYVLSASWIIVFLLGCYLVTFFNENNNDGPGSDVDDVATI